MSDKRHPEILRGIAALLAMLNEIGGYGDETHDGDKEIAKILCDNEMDLRDLAQYAVTELALEI